MPSKRTRRSHHRHGTPNWADTLIETGEVPDKNDPNFDAFIGWKFFDEAVPGLPPATSREGQDLLRG